MVSTESENRKQQIDLAKELSQGAKRHLREVGIGGYSFNNASLRRLFAVYDIPVVGELERVLERPGGNFVIDARMVARSNTRRKMSDLANLLSSSLTTTEHLSSVQR